ncbi:hypothetical protein K474DRAFT_1713946 [Panus rudis PR-1116 ss-1]|nr:hypothetical protein K474DRAFT_1713946 [Panus rudis PR-1116 ss-1]
MSFMPSHANMQTRWEMGTLPNGQGYPVSPMFARQPQAGVQYGEYGGNSMLLSGQSGGTTPRQAGGAASALEELTSGHDGIDCPRPEDIAPASDRTAEPGNQAATEKQNPEETDVSNNTVPGIGVPFAEDVIQIVEEGVRYELEKEDASTDEESEPRLAVTGNANGRDEVSLVVDDKRNMVDGWHILCTLIPGFRQIMKAAIKEGRSLRAKGQPCAELKKGIESVRADDTSRLKKHAVYYVSEKGDKLPSGIVTESSMKKEMQGWANSQTATLLLPLKYDPNPQIFLDISQGKRPHVTADKWFRMLYPDGRTYIPNKPEADMFCGYFLVRCAKCLYIGHIRVFSDGGYAGGTSRETNAQKCGLSITGMTPRALAYACIQAHFQLSQQPEWSLSDRHFNVKKFYWNVVEILKGEAGRATLRWYDEILFGLGRITPNMPHADITSSNSEDSDDEDGLQAIAAARAAKAAESAEGAQ